MTNAASARAVYPHRLLEPDGGDRTPPGDPDRGGTTPSAVREVASARRPRRAAPR